MGFVCKGPNVKTAAAAETSNTLNNPAVIQEPEDGSITADKLADGSVTADKIAENCVGTKHIVDGSITLDKLSDEASGAHDTGGIADNSITTRHIADESITTDKLADGSVTPDKLSGINFGEANAEDGSITADMLADSSVTAKKLANSSVTASKIASNAVTGSKIKNGEIAFNKLTEAVQNRIVSLEEQNNYSDTPQKIGEWINGLPVWRIAFEEVWDDYEEIMRNGSVSVESLLAAVNDAAGIYAVINAHAAASQVEEDEYGNVTLKPNAPVNVPLMRAYTNNSAGCSFDLTQVRAINAELTENGDSESTLRGMHGWVDFVTDEENILK